MSPLPGRVIRGTWSGSKWVTRRSFGSPMEASIARSPFWCSTSSRIRAKALDEMIRVTRPGGTVAAAVWDYGQGMEMLRVFWDEAIALSPAMDARDERHMPLSRKGELAALWRAHALQDVVEETLTIQTRFVSFDDYWSPFLEKQGPAGEYVASLPAGERDQLRLRLRRRLLGDGPDRPIVLAARAWAVRGSARPKGGLK